MMYSYLPVQLTPCWLLVGAETVQEVLGAVPWSRIPRADPRVPGVMTWRARAVPVIDLAAGVSGISALAAAGTRQRTLVLRADMSTFAVPVDAVREVVRLDPQSFAARHVGPPGLVELEAEVAGTTMGVFDAEQFTLRLRTSLGEGHA